MTRATLRTSLALAGVVVLSAVAGELEAAGAERFAPPRAVGPHTATFQVPEVYGASRARGWPHVLSAAELRGLGREVYRAHRVLYPRNRVGRRAVCTTLYGAPQCVVVNRRGLAVRGSHVRIWEDGSGRVRFFAPVR